MITFVWCSYAHGLAVTYPCVCTAGNAGGGSEGDAAVATYVIRASHRVRICLMYICVCVSCNLSRDAFHLLLPCLAHLILIALCSLPLLLPSHSKLVPTTRRMPPQPPLPVTQSLVAHARVSTGAPMRSSWSVERAQTLVSAEEEEEEEEVDSYLGLEGPPSVHSLSHASVQTPTHTYCPPS